METLILLYLFSATLYYAKNIRKYAGNSTFKEEVSNLKDYTRKIQEGTEKEGEEVKKAMSIAKVLAAVVAVVSAAINIAIAAYLKNPGFWIMTILCTTSDLCRMAWSLKRLGTDMTETFERQRYFSLVEQIFFMGYYLMGVILVLVGLAG